MIKLKDAKKQFKAKFDLKKEVAIKRAENQIQNALKTCQTSAVVDCISAVHQELCSHLRSLGYTVRHNSDNRVIISGWADDEEE